MKKIKEILDKTIDLKKTYLLLLIVISLGLVSVCFSYAIFTSEIEKNGVLNIIVGNLYLSVDTDDLDNNNQITVGPKQTGYVMMEVENINSIDAKHQIYYKTIQGVSPVVTSYELDESNSLAKGTVLEKYGSSTSSQSIVLGIVNHSNTNSVIEINTAIGLPKASLSLPNDVGLISVEEVAELPKEPNNHILATYIYDPDNTNTLCITGEESTCVQRPITQTSIYENGTIINYQVNDNENYYFHVLHDDGDKLILQHRENTTTSSWYQEDINSSGPLNAITALEKETSDWDNVLDQTYTMGSTVFGNASSAFTGCSEYNSCATNTYTWEERTGKARFITMQEVEASGCATSTASCPIYMINYLAKAGTGGGTVEIANIDSYWIMSANSYRGSSAYAWFVRGQGRVGTSTYTVTGNIGVRAVIEIEKYE